MIQAHSLHDPFMTLIKFIFQLPPKGGSVLVVSKVGLCVNVSCICMPGDSALEFFESQGSVFTGTNADIGRSTATSVNTWDQILVNEGGVTSSLIFSYCVCKHFVCGNQGTTNNPHMRHTKCDVIC